jgi:hypothetical protein
MLLAAAVKETQAVRARLAVLLEMLVEMVLTVLHIQAAAVAAHLPQEQIQL